MFTRALTLMLAFGTLGAVGCVAGSDAATEDQSAVSQNTGSGGGTFSNCQNNSKIVGLVVVNDVLCQGTVSVLPINVDVKDVRVLDDNELNILTGDLNNLSILDGGILNNNKILNDVETNVLTDFLTKFNINIVKNDIDVCTLLNVCI